MSRTPVVLVSLFTMSCIIPTDPTYDPPANTPPVVLEDSANPPMNGFVDIDLDAPSGPDGGTSQERFEVTVRDPDLEDRLEGIVFIDYDPDSASNPALTQVTIPPSMSATRRVEFFVDRTIREIAVEGGCHVLELHVSSAFGNNFQPEVEDDIGRGYWFLRVRGASDQQQNCRPPESE